MSYDPFAEIRGQEIALTTLRRAVESSRVHHAYRFEGPAGVGKELAAFALAQTLVCERSDTPFACGECSACKRTVELTSDEPHVPKHPDVVLVQRGLYPASSLGGNVSEATGISVLQIRRIVLARTAVPPAEGRALVFIVRDAEELTPSAANALLKTLEEPSRRVHFVLLTSRPGRLLDTILSRTLAVRFAPLSDELVAELLRERDLDDSIASLAQGSMAAALELADADKAEAREQLVESMRAAVTAPDLGSALMALELKNRDRHALREDLGYLAHTLASRARAQVAADPRQAELAARRYALVTETLNALDANAQPSLAMESLVTRLRTVR